MSRERNGFLYVSLEIKQIYTIKGTCSYLRRLICVFRQVQSEEGKVLAEQWNCAWTEASARHNDNVAKAFELVIGEVEKQFAPPPEEKGKCIIS